MSYPQIVEYHEAVQHPSQAFVDPELKQGAVAENNLGLPLVMSGGFALTYAVTTPRRKCAVRCFHREIPAIQQKYDAIAKKLRSLGNDCFVHFDFQQSGINVRQQTFPIVRMDWVEGDTLGIWLDKHFGDTPALEKARTDFAAIARFLELKGIAHGDIQNGNVMVAGGDIKLIDYDGMFVPGMRPGNGSEAGHKHFQHPDRKVSDFGPKMDRFSFIALDLSLRAVVEDKSLYPKFREGGETIVFKANDFADPDHSEVFQRLLAMPKLKEQTRRFAAICEAPLAAAPTLDEFLAGQNIPAAKTQITTRPSPTARSAPASYISAYPVVDALNFSAAMQRVGDRVELIGRIVEVKPGARKAGKGSPKRYVFINFGSSRGNVVKISIWSEGLAKLKEKPSTAWVGRWVSVTGLIDVPYENKRSGHKHLSITVQDDGQIQQLSETEAGFRLASMSSAPPPRSRSVAPAAEPATSPAKAPAAAPPSKPARPPAVAKATKAKPKTVLSRGSRKARSPKSAGQPTSIPPSQPAPQPTQSRGLLDWLRRWMS
ncbi:serine/threonine protein kinase [Bradyrhizobium sp.]|uniref:serine/threonine protein kinase n=1 Tax=Bradyrhizobium sp. TaxID=376 RepID=UPI001EC3CD4D|nr:serine/threonine protein kinase [Bradyrhizobium sp.]MBV8917446.1 serine/threonine protein kinase [Bradyrhizobium sp.]MBV9981591.1 serine/threonine protein kinase [Bradyrhizobium sp.]